MKKRVLIVDDEESVLLVLKNSLNKLGNAYEVVTATNAFTALEEVQERPFDLVVTDYKMADMDGLQLMEAIRTIQPQARLVMMTAYGTEKLEKQATELDAYRYLTKPLEINTFRQIVREALSSEDVAISRPGILVLSDVRYRQVMTLLQELQANVGSRCIILTDANGQMIAHAGDVGGLHLEQIASLLCGGMATLQAAGSALDGDENAIHLAYREGERDNLYVVNIGAQLLLIVIIENGPYSSRLGSAWYYARQTAVTLRQTLGEADYATAPQIFDSPDVDEVFDSELDKLFEFGEETAVAPRAAAPPPSPAAQRPSPAPAAPRPSPAQAPTPPPSAVPPSGGQGKLMGFKEAMAQGLIGADLSERT
jgi:two-component system, response regulator, stage 0 sporulation protein F